MTCIVGVVEGGKVWMGGDSATCRDYVMCADALPKVVKRGEFVIGVCGDSRVSDLMGFAFRPPALPKQGSLDGYMVKKFAGAMRRCLADNGYERDSEDSEQYNGMVLVGVRGRLYEIDAQFSMTRSLAGFTAVGSGEDVALGVLHATVGRGAQERIQLALEIAAKVCNTVCPPFVVESV